MHDPEEETPESYATTTSRRVNWTADLDTVRRLFQDYREWVFEHREEATASAGRVQAGLAVIDELVAGLPGAYGPPHGDVLLWYDEGGLAACGVLRELEPRAGEIKRVFIRPDHRGMVFGRIFVQGLIDRARALGYERLRVDTLPTMASAIEFYQELGFRPIPAFWPHPAAGALFFECRLGG